MAVFFSFGASTRLQTTHNQRSGATKAVLVYVGTGSEALEHLVIIRYDFASTISCP